MKPLKEESTTKRIYLLCYASMAIFCLQTAEMYFQKDYYVNNNDEIQHVKIYLDP